MRIYALSFLAVAPLSVSSWVYAQQSSPLPSAPKTAPVEQPPSSNTVMRTKSTSVLDDRKRLGSTDYVSFRVVEDRDGESQHLRVTDNGELEVPYIGLVPAARSEERRVGKEW